MNSHEPAVDIIIPVYNEGETIVTTLHTLAQQVKMPVRVLICYDFDGDNTLPAVKNGVASYPNLPVEFVKNPSRGPHAAIMGGFAASTAPMVIVFPADDHFNAGILDRMAAFGASGHDIVCASRFIPGGTMEGCPWLKAALVRTAAFLLYFVARLPTHDPTSGFRLFSRRLIDTVKVESTEGFCYSIELLVKAHRLGWRVAEVPALWFVRSAGQSRFKVLRWLPAYLRWFFYAFATTYLRRPASSVPRVTVQQKTV